MLNKLTVLGFIALVGVYAGGAKADEKKPDSWCAVIEKQIDRVRDAESKPHDSAASERMREERRRLDKDAHDRHCPGH
jgi:hypothetical protein